VGTKSPRRNLLPYLLLTALTLLAGLARIAVPGAMAKTFGASTSPRATAARIAPREPAITVSGLPEIRGLSDSVAFNWARLVG
jgi:hypothetical protein